ncbi:MAG: bifunctional phosphopantothenoylcysteine decarboxylase/phosphopantothenate--cysteine ligase CoaBC [Polyangiaceae bacterium]|nr:bifunctional phosphopantothenoylcysteine decarboxylase/phosphopantothenate--cysteine ligase CoaBC [Polyangiaceae bacterium]
MSKTVALCVSGSIAAYKAVEVARLLGKAGVRVLPVFTESAAKFVGPVTFSGITGEPVRTSMWDASFPGEMHVKLAQDADVVAMVPATADLLARLAQGRADDLVTALALSARGPVLVAPSMHPRMWAHPSTTRNAATLRADGVRFVGPVDGPVASGETGMGRMSEPADIVSAILLAAEPGDLAGLSLLVTAGPTYEDIDPVRFLGNRSSGKMGFALAARAAARGAQVKLVAGPVAEATPPGVQRVDVRSAEEMRAAVMDARARVDVVIMSAAVADFRPEAVSASKLKKSDGAPALRLTQNPDILAELGQGRTGTAPFLVGFALETGADADVIAYAREKLVRKRVDLVVANHAAESLGKDENRIHLVDASGVETHGPVPKGALADVILTRVRGALRGAAPAPPAPSS